MILGRLTGRLSPMFLVVVLAIVAGGSFFVARTIQRGIVHRHLIGNAPGASLRSNWTPRTALLTALLTVALFVPGLFLMYEGVALVRHALGQ
jgi:hypothetical protein